MKKTLIGLLLFSCVSVHAQKKSAFGFSLNGTDFETPAKISQTSLGDVLKDGFFGKVQPGFSLVYWKGITSRLDVSARYNGIFSNGEIVSSKASISDYFNELEAAAHLRAFKDYKVVNPFLTAGAGVGKYWSKGFAGYAPFGLGIQINLLSETYLYVQGNYRWSFNTSKLPSSTFYSFGIAQSLNGAKAEKPVKQVPLPVVENPDRDNDGFENNVDQCPDTSGTVQGCPDMDKDGIADKDDRCPQDSGVLKYAGCPIPDTDGDGINDDEDKCKDTAGVAEYQGCPIPDRDKDGVLDVDDKCPDLPGIASNAGCPEIKQEVIAKVNKSAESILFTPGKDVIDKRSYKGLNSVADILKGDATYNLTVAGHTDNTGTDGKNQTLSEKRAMAIKKYLVKKGVPDDRIYTVGYGSTQPIADNKTAKGRAKNRRVELTVRNYIVD